jgi:hypothetical protein
MRAIIRNGRLTLTHRPMFLQARRTLTYARALQEAGTTICDLEIERSDHSSELIVRFVPAGSESDEAVETLLSWAELAGFGRVWLPDRIVELGSTLVPDPDTLEAVACPTCGIEDGDFLTADALAMLRRRGHIPRLCPVCGEHKPEWTAPRQARSTT